MLFVVVGCLLQALAFEVYFKSVISSSEVSL